MALVQPSPQLQVQIRKLLNEDVDKRDGDLQAIKDWLRKQPHLPDTWDEHRMLTFLRGCKFSLEKCKRKLDMYFTMRAAIPEFFTNRDVLRPELQEVLRIGQGPVMPGLTAKGYRVTIIRAATPDIDVQSVANTVANAMKLGLMMGDVRLLEEETGVAGDVFIVDASCANFTRFAQMNPIIVKKFLICVQEAYPVLVKEVHIVNVSPVVDAIISFVVPFVKEKLRNRVHVHSKFESLHEHISKDLLPEEYGGTAGKMSKFNDDWAKKLEMYGPWFKEQENVKADESKRPGKPTNYDDLFGLEGSFRQLSID